MSRCVWAILEILLLLSTTSPVSAVSLVPPSYHASSYIARSSIASYYQGKAGFMKSEEMRSLIRQAAQAWMVGDADAFASLFVTNGEFIVPGNRWVGQAEIRKAADDFASTHSEVEISIRRIIIEENQAVVEWHWQDKENATNCRTQADDAIVVDFKDGQISRWREYIDTQTPSRKL